MGTKHCGTQEMYRVDEVYIVFPSLFWAVVLVSAPVFSYSV
jgi:hypothetical protein